jgi:single-strand DNA-binding protein
MANDLNQCSFIGRLGADPETRYTQGGDPVCSFRIAVGWKTKEKDGVEWVSVSAFGKLAEICSKFLAKGSQVFVQGRMKTDKYTDREGFERYSTKITADTVQMLGSPRGDTNPQADRHTSSSDAQRKPQGDSDRPANRPKPSFDDLGDGVPF